MPEFEKQKFKKPPIYFRNWDLRDGVYKPLFSSGSRGVYELDYFNDVDSILVDGSSRYFAVVIVTGKQIGRAHV